MTRTSLRYCIAVVIFVFAVKHDVAYGFGQLLNGVDLNQVSEMVPAETRKFYESLKSSDKDLLRDVVKKGFSYESFNEVLGDLRNGSSTLYDHAVSLVTSTRSLVAGLSPEARKFVDDSVAEMRDGLSEYYTLGKIRSHAQSVVKRYRALESATQDELKKAFPSVAMVIDNSIFQMLANSMFGISDDTSGAVEEPKRASTDVPADVTLEAPTDAPADERTDGTVEPPMKLIKKTPREPTTVN